MPEYFALAHFAHAAGAVTWRVPVDVPERFQVTASAFVNSEQMAGVVLHNSGNKPLHVCIECSDLEWRHTIPADAIVSVSGLRLSSVPAQPGPDMPKVPVNTWDFPNSEEGFALACIEHKRYLSSKNSSISQSEELGEREKWTAIRVSEAVQRLFFLKSRLGGYVGLSRQGPHRCMLSLVNDIQDAIPLTVFPWRGEAEEYDRIVLFSDYGAIHMPWRKDETPQFKMVSALRGNQRAWEVFAVVHND